MEIQYAASDDLFLSAFENNYSPDIAVMITTFLIHLLVLAGQGVFVLFSLKLSHELSPEQA